MDRDPGDAAPSPSRRRLLAAAGAAGAVTALGAAPAPASARPHAGPVLSFTEATNGSATLAPDGTPRGALRALTTEPADHLSWSPATRGPCGTSPKPACG